MGWGWGWGFHNDVINTGGADDQTRQGMWLCMIIREKDTQAFGMNDALVDMVYIS